jgi:fructokinase
MKDLIERVWEYSQNNPDGFTLNIETLKEVKFGIVVAYEETQNSFGKQSLQTVIDHALKNNKTVGGWLNEENGLFYFDSVKVFKNSELVRAIEFGMKNKQIAIFDLTNLKEINLEG